MNVLIEGAIGVEVTLERGISSYKLYSDDVLEGKQLVYVNFCNSWDVPKTPSGNSTLMTGVDKLMLRLVDKNSGVFDDYSLTDIESQSDKLRFYQSIDFEQSTLVLTCLDNPEYYHGRSIYLIFWFGKLVNESNNGKTEIYPLELKLNGYKTFFMNDNILKNKNIVQIIFSMPGITPLGNTGIDRSVISNKFVSFSNGKSLIFSKIPLYLFFLSFVEHIHCFDLLNIDFGSSFVESLTKDEFDMKTLFFNVIVNI